jgi:hypothetical protein
MTCSHKIISDNSENNHCEGNCSDMDKPGLKENCCNDSATCLSFNIPFVFSEKSRMLQFSHEPGLIEANTINSGLQSSQSPNKIYLPPLIVRDYSRLFQVYLN